MDTSDGSPKRALEIPKGKFREKSIEARIHEQYESLPESERKLAEVILDFPGDLSAFKASELTALAGVSKAAATRLFHRLGFQSFDEARLLSRERREWGSPLYMESKPGTATSSGSLTALLKDETDLLRASLPKLDANTLDEVVGQIVGARRVFLIGFRNSRFIAEYFRWQLLQFRGDVHLVPGNGETIGEFLADLTPTDVVFVVALRRRIKELHAILTSVRDRGTPIALLTDPTARRLPGLATWILTVETRGAFPFDSCGPALAICRHLSVQALHKAGRRGRAHLERIERQHERLDIFN
ncbi:MurR/RpiR family transcriptional regulator [Rhodospirillum sp. A1_3_36]|uniref:MurR/RpiR family transcriptional regulator n=1 Tax=Rhodospirillum sp. A1_3_36 TaxID=3391666 RepID=UPI0039A50FC3